MEMGEFATLAETEVAGARPTLLPDTAQAQV